MVCPKLKSGSCRVLKNPCKKKYIAKMTGACPVNKGGKAAKAMGSAAGKKKAKKAAGAKKPKAKKTAKKKKR